MNNTTKTSLIALSVLLVCLMFLAKAGLFNEKHQMRLPIQALNAGVMSAQEFDHLLLDSPSSIRSITFYKGMRSILADVEPLGAQRVDFGKTVDLYERAEKAKVKVNISNPEIVTDSNLESVSWQFWAVFALCGTSILALLWRNGSFSRIPGMEAYAPAIASAKNDPEDKKTFDDVAGCEESIAKLRRVARWLEFPERYEQFGAKLPKGILAVGPPGTGKTLLARALAGEVNGNFYPVHASSFIEMFVGVGARRVRKLFETAEAAHKRTGKPSIIFIDEIDAIGKKRSQGGTGGDAERDQTLNQLLVCMQGFENSKGILVMAATNMPETLDEALTRPGRFDYQVNVDLPDTYGREKIFAIHTKGFKLSAKVNLRDFAIRTPQFSGADIEQACNEAAISAAERIESMIMENGLESVKESDRVIEVDDFDKGIDYVQFGDPMLSRARAMSQSDKRNTAIHEAGHCAIQQVLQKEGADPITKVTIEPRTKSLGSMQSHSEGDQYSYTEQQLLARITTAMGGRVAQEHFLGRKDTGASNDFQQATNLARLMVTEFGLSKLGPIWVGRDALGNSSKTGNDLADLIDMEWRRIVDECYERAVKIVKENERKIERISDSLLADQTILGDRFRELWNAEFQEDESLDAINCSPVACV